MPTPSVVKIAFAKDPIFAAVKAHQAAWDLAGEASAMTPLMTSWLLRQTGWPSF
jgi:hypothetical protein